MEVLKTDLLGEMRSRHDTFVLCISMVANLGLSAIAAMSLHELKEEVIFTVRKVVVGYTSVISHPRTLTQKNEYKL